MHLRLGSSLAPPETRGFLGFPPPRSPRLLSANSVSLTGFKVPRGQDFSSERPCYGPGALPPKWMPPQFLSFLKGFERVLKLQALKGLELSL